MRKKTKGLSRFIKGVSFGAMFVVLMIGLLITPCSSSASDEVRVIRLLSNIAGGLSYQIPFLIEPETLTVKKDTVVVFVNVANYQAEVSFEEGKTCQLGTKATEGFAFDEAKACYATVVLPNGGSRSLRFMENGLYKYKVNWSGRPEPSMGKIIVY